jgi:hypothetical protein
VDLLADYLKISKKMSNNINFALVCEGISDQAVLENILSGFRNDTDNNFTNFRIIQPTRNAANAGTNRGGWFQVFEYCAGEKFPQLFNNDYVVIQIDTDTTQLWHYNPKGFSNSELGFSTVGLSFTQILYQVKCRFELIFNTIHGTKFLETNNNKIIYAISIEAVECWLLPLQGFSCQHTNCYELLGKPKKSHQIYLKLSNTLADRTKLLDYSAQNISLQTFIDELVIKNIPVCP